jgi:hypothetical protein
MLAKDYNYDKGWQEGWRGKEEIVDREIIEGKGQICKR